MTAIVLWVPMLDGDTHAVAAQQAASWHDGRVHHWWDASKQMSHSFQRVLGLQAPAWDVYLLYAQGTNWENELPPPLAYPRSWFSYSSSPAPWMGGAHAGRGMRQKG